MKKTVFLIAMLLSSSLLFLHNAFTQAGLPEGAKARFGKGYKTGSSIFSDDGTRFAVSSNVGVWIYDVFTAQEVALLTNHPREFTVLAASPDGNMLASANENVIFLWDIHTGRRIARFTEHSENIRSLVFSSDGKVLASASEDNTVRLWNTTTGRLLFLPLRGHTGDVIAIAFSPDNKMLASGSRDNSIRLWSVTTGQHLATLEEQVVWGTVTHEGHTGDVTALAFSSDGTTLASGGTDNKIRLWDVGAGEHRTAISAHWEHVTALAFSPDSTILASGSTDDTIRLWNPSTHRHLDTLEGHRSDVITLAFSESGAILASGDAGAFVLLWDGNTGQHLANRSLGNEIYQQRYIHWENGSRTTLTTYWSLLTVAFSPDGTLASGESRRSYLDGVRISSGRGHYPNVSVHRNNSRYADITYSTDGKTQLWHPFLEYPRTLTDDFLVSSVAFSPDGKMLASGGEYLQTTSISWRRFCSVFGGNCYRVYSPEKADPSYPLKLWNFDTERFILLEGHDGRVSSVAFSPNSKILASSSWDNTIRLWNPTTGQHLTTFRGHGDNVNSVAFSADGGTLASGSSDYTIKLWNSDGRVRATLYGHGDDVRTVAFSPDGKILASGGDDNTVRLWNPTTGQHTATLEGHTDWVRSVAFSPDSGTLASASDDRTIRLWDSATGQHLTTFRGHRGYVYSVSFSPDGTTLASGSSDCTILLWEIEPAVSQNPLDVNGDGVINILDLAAVAANFGQTGQNPADVNGDGVVNVNDIVLVAGAMGTAPAAPSISPQILETLTVADVQKWLTDAEQLKLTDAKMQKGIIVLQQLLEALRQAEAIPAETVLLPNYPNPFNPETWIPYQLAEAADVTMTLYAANGRLVRTLALGYQPAGVYRSRTRAAYWDGRNEFGEPVASGVYFYTLTAGEYTATRKMLIRK